MGEGIVNDAQTLNRFLELTHERQAFWTETLSLNARFDVHFNLKPLIQIVHQQLIDDAS